MYHKLFLLFLLVGLSFGEVRASSATTTQAIDAAVERAAVQTAQQPSVVAQAQKYLTAYYGRRDFSAPQWVRVKNFQTWLTQNKTRLDSQFKQSLGAKWDTFPAEKQEAALGAWLGMKYAVDKIGNAPDKQFPIVLEEKIWDTECGDHSYRRNIYCSKGDFVSKVNISLHEAVHLLPYLNRRYRPGHDFEDSYREKYTVAAQLRYALPAKKTTNYGGGTRSFFPLLNSKQALKLLNEYAEGIAALVDYEKIWASTPWPLHEDNSNESFDMRLRAVVFDKLGVSTDEESSFYSFAVNNYFNDVGWEIAHTYCKDLPAEHDKQVEFLHKCMDTHATEILKLASQKLKPLVSKKIPPVPDGYQ